MRRSDPASPEAPTQVTVMLRTLPCSDRSLGDGIRNECLSPQACGEAALCIACEMIESKRIDNGSPRRLPFNVHLLFEASHANQRVDGAVPVTAGAVCGESRPWR